MNKKLFSWKALAGLALLVAMGLTSCKQSTEVDPNDPYNTQKPTQPGVTEKGTADLTFTIKEAGDLSTLWKNYDNAKKTELMKKTTIIVDVNFKDFEIKAGETLVIPNFFNTVANSNLTVRLNGNFKNADKQVFNLDCSTNLQGALVNVVLPAQAFDLNLNSAGTRANLSSAGATLGTLFTNADLNKNNALSINGGVIVKGIDVTSKGAVLVSGGTIEALITGQDSIETVKEKGFKIGNQEVYTSNLIVKAANVLVKTDDKTPLGNIIINKNCSAVFKNPGTTAASVTGTAAGESKLTLTGAADDLKNIGALKNVEVSNKGKGLTIKKDIFDGVKISEDVTLEATTLAGVEITGDITINYTANNTTYGFSGVKVASKKSIKVKGSVEVPLTPTKTTYQWDIVKKIWVEVTADAPIYAANASDTGIEVSSSDVSVSGGVLKDDNNKVGDHKVFTIVSGTKEYVCPENCSLVLDEKCAYAGSAIIDNNINNAIKYVGTVDPVWFTVKVGNDNYIWKKAGSASDYYWVLVKK